MLTVLLIIIYISFISLGLPDSLLGSAWPAVHSDLGVQLSFAGVISMIVSCGTVISSLMSTRLIKRFGTGTVTLVSVGLTAAALLGFGFSDSAIWFCLLAVPLGLGAGSVDAALNNFVALHYKAMHMNWLHCFWGIGATSGPVIMAVWLAKEGGWRMGYRTIGLLQTALVLVLVLTLPLWKKASGAQLKAEAGTVGILLLLQPGDHGQSLGQQLRRFGLWSQRGYRRCLKLSVFSWDHSGKACFRLCLNPDKDGDADPYRRGLRPLRRIASASSAAPMEAVFGHLPCGHWLCAHIPLHAAPYA